MNDFGKLLRKFRQASNDPAFEGRRLSQQRLGQLLADQLGLNSIYSGAAVSDWERGHSRIRADNRRFLLSLIKVLYDCGGIQGENDANRLLLAGQYSPLSEDETRETFWESAQGVPAGTSGSLAQGLPKLDERNEAFSDNWPPGIPLETYFPLPEREGLVQELLHRLEDRDGARIISIEGLGGQGKTALAAELARRARSAHIVDGVIGETAKLEGFAGGAIVPLQSPRLDYENLLNGLARQLKRWELFTMQLREKEFSLAAILSAGTYLLLIDNLETAENAQALVGRLGGILGKSRALITSRQQVRNGSAHSVQLGGLSSRDSLEFLRAESERIGSAALLKAARPSLTEIHQLTGGSPLALKLVVAQSKHLDLDKILDQLRAARGQLFPFIYRSSWEQLMPAAQVLLLYIGKTVADNVGFQELAETQLLQDEAALFAAIDQLIAYSLLQSSPSPAGIRYSVHALTRQFLINDVPDAWRQQGLL